MTPDKGNTESLPAAPEDHKGKRDELKADDRRALAEGEHDISAPLIATKPEAKVEAGDKTKAEKPADTKEDEGLPENEWSKQYFGLKQQLKENPSSDGPLMQAALMLLKLAAKYGHYLDLFPGSFAARLDKDEKLKDTKFDKEKADKVIKGDGKDEKTNTDELAALAAAEKQKGEGQSLSQERASTRYVTNALWGINDIDDAGTLAASLLHTKKHVEGAKDIGLYGVAETLNELKTQEKNEKGTILIFATSIMEGEKFVAYATGNGKEYKYYDVKQARAVTFKLDDVNSPIKNQVQLLLALIPNIEEYNQTKEVEVPDKKDLPETTEKSLTEFETNNKNVDTEIKTQEKLAEGARDVAKITTIVATADQNLAAVKKTHEEIKKQADKLDTKIKACQKIMTDLQTKIDAETAGPEEKSSYDTASKNLTTWTAEKKKVDESLTKILGLEEEANKNSVSAKALEISPKKT